MSATSAPTTTPTALVLPFTGQDLRQAVAAHDTAGLMNLAHQLRVAGYRVEPQRLATELLQNGCTWLVDPFGQRVPLQVRVPARSRPGTAESVDASVPFRLSA